jgi:arsenite methyltransferase
MTDTLHFNDKAAEQLLAAYVTPDVKEQRQKVIDVLQLQTGQKVLDIGSGPGYLASDMAAIVGQNGEAHGVDISEELLALARGKYANQPQLKFHNANATSLPFSDEYFDVVVVTQVLEYLPNVDVALSEFRRVLRSGGRILVLDTDWDSIVWHSNNPGRMKKVLQVWDEHLVDPYLPRILMAKLTSAGFNQEYQTIIPLFNPRFDEDTFSNRMIDLIGSFVRGRQGLTEHEVDAWAEDLRRNGKQGEYFFSLNRYVFVASKV